MHKTIDQSQLLNRSALNGKAMDDKENSSILSNKLVKLFPERAIKASSFIDMFNTSRVGSGTRQVIRIRNPLKKLA